MDIRPSLHGMGLFALKPFDKDELVVPYIGEYISDDELNRRYGKDAAPYAIDIEDGQTLDSACTRGLGSYANDYRTDPKDPKKNKAAMNVELSDERSTEFGGVWIKATKKIAPGQEMLVDYGKDYWRGNHPPHQTLKRKLKQTVAPYSQQDAEADFQRAIGSPSAFHPAFKRGRPDRQSTNKVKLHNIMDVYKSRTLEEKSVAAYTARVEGLTLQLTGGKSSPTVEPKEAESRCMKVYNMYRRVTGGADGSTGYGMNGSLSYPSMCAVLRALGVNEYTTFVDIGAAEGRALACAAALGARLVIGYELPGPAQDHERFFNAAMDKLGLTARAKYIHRDISTVASLPSGATCVYTFWDGFHPDTKDHIIKLIARCPTVRSACVFLRGHSVRELTESFEASGRRYISSSIIRVKMFGSGEQQSAVILNF